MAAKKWTPATLVKPKNYIVSSEVVASGQKSFTPTFEKEAQPSMSDLLSNSYSTKWFEERDEYEKQTYKPQESKTKRSKKLLLRTKSKNEVKLLRTSSLSRYQNVPSKVNSRR